MKNKILRELWNYGVDMIVIIGIFIFLLRMVNTHAFLSPILLTLLLYLLIRSVFVKYIGLTIIMNLFMILFLVSGPLLIKIENADAIYKNFGILFGLVVFTTIQVFVIIYRAFNYKLEKSIEGNRWYHKLLNRMFFIIDYTSFIFNIIIALIYPMILSIAIIIMFSGLYNSVNYYYSISGKDLGVYNVETEKTLQVVENSSGDMFFSDIVRLNEEGYIYFSAVTFFTIGYGDYLPHGVHILKTLLCMK